MPHDRTYGYDMPYYDWSPISTRPPLQWPNQERVALSILLSIDHYQWKPTNTFNNGGMPGSLPKMPINPLRHPAGLADQEGLSQML